MINFGVIFDERVLPKIPLHNPIIIEPLILLIPIVIGFDTYYLTLGQGGFSSKAIKYCICYCRFHFLRIYVSNFSNNNCYVQIYYCLTLLLYYTQ